MKTRRSLIIALGTITILSILAFILYNYFQSKLPDSLNRSIFLWISILLTTATFLAALKDIIELFEKIFSPTTSNSKNKYDVYISYSQADLPFVQSIEEKMRRKGVKTWIFTNQASIGTKIDETMQKAIINSKTAVFFIGQRSLTPWQQKELNWAMNALVPVMPALVPNMNFTILQSIPELSNILAVQFKTATDQDALDKLIQGIKAHM